MCSTYAIAAATPQLLNLGPAHGALPPLRLQIDDVQAQAVLADNAIDPFIAALANGLAGVGAGAAVSHPQKQIHHEALEESGGGRLDSREDLSGEAGFDPAVRRLQLFLWGFGVGDMRCGQVGGGLFGLTLGLLELSELGILREKLHVDPRGLRIEDLTAPGRDDEATSLRRLQQAAPLQIDPRPRHPIGKPSLTSARQQLVLLGLCELECGAQSAAGIPEEDPSVNMRRGFWQTLKLFLRTSS